MKKKKARQELDKRTIKFESRKEWALLTDSAASTIDADVVTFAVVIGGHQCHKDPSLATARSLTGTVIMFIEEHSPGKWHNAEHGWVDGALVGGQGVRGWGAKPSSTGNLE